MSDPKTTDKASISKHSPLANSILLSSLFLNKANDQKCGNAVPKLLQYKCQRNQERKGDFTTVSQQKLNFESILVSNSLPPAAHFRNRIFPGRKQSSVQSPWDEEIIPGVCAELMERDG